MADRLLGILRHQALEFGLGLFVLEVIGQRCRRILPRLEPLISTIRTAWMRGFGGSTPNRRGARRFPRTSRISAQLLGRGAGRGDPHGC
jgi:hypothetical protein